MPEIMQKETVSYDPGVQAVVRKFLGSVIPGPSIPWLSRYTLGKLFFMLTLPSPKPKTKE